MHSFQRLYKEQKPNGTCSGCACSLPDIIVDSRVNVQERLLNQQDEQRRHTAKLEEQLASVTTDRDEYHRYIRELEQCNDDLERAKRLP